MPPRTSAGGPEPRTANQVSARRIPYSQGGWGQRSARQQQAVPDVDTSDTNLIKVSSTSQVKGIAGKIAHDVRDKGGPPTILTIGPASINQAMKAIAVARGYLAQDDKDLTCQPAFREGMSDLAMALYLNHVPGNNLKQTIVADELVVKSATARPSLAGAIAARVRDRKAVYLLAKGADAVSNAISAVCHARGFLEDDKLDLHCAPKFVELENQDGHERSTFMRIDIRSTTSA